MPTVKEKADEKFIGSQFDDPPRKASPELGGGTYCSAEYNKFTNDRIAMWRTMPFISYSRAIKSRDEIETKLRAVRMERDKLNKNIADLEADLQAANFTVDAVGATEVP